jgi:hypothetical protein
MNGRDEPGSHGGGRRPIALVVAASAIVIALSLLWSAAESHYRSCLAKADAKYPAVPVSAFVGRDKQSVGPLKVSFAKERAAAANDCHRVF